MRLYRCIKTFTCHSTIDDNPVEIVIPYGNVSQFEDTEYRPPNVEFWEEIDVVIKPVSKRTPMKSRNELAEEFAENDNPKHHVSTNEYAMDCFLAGYDSRDAEIVILETEKQNLLAAAESDLLRMAELRDENKYLKERVALLLKEHMEQL